MSPLRDGPRPIHRTAIVGNCNPQPQIGSIKVWPPACGAQATQPGRAAAAGCLPHRQQRAAMTSRATSTTGITDSFMQP